MARFGDIKVAWDMTAFNEMVRIQCLAHECRHHQAVAWRYNLKTLEMGPHGQCGAYERIAAKKPQEAAQGERGAKGTLLG